jgi:hypothetical protein
MAAKPLPSYEVLHKLLDYDPATGVLRWRARTPDMFKPGNKTAESNCQGWNSKYAGRPAGMIGPSGYVVVMIDYGNFMAHRLIWKMVHGRDPFEIDHIDGVRQNNLVSNLRDVSRRQNNCNRRVRKDSTSGILGVYWEARRKKWVIDARLNGERRIGSFSTIEEAAAARKRVDVELGFHPNHGRQ